MSGASTTTVAAAVLLALAHAAASAHGHGSWQQTGEAKVPYGWFGFSPQGVAVVGEDGAPATGVIFSGKHLLRRTSLPVPATGSEMAYATEVENRKPIPPELAVEGYEHIGDVAAAFDTLYAPIEKQATYTAPVIAFYDPNSLDYVGHYTTAQHHCPWVAVDAAHGILFSSEYSNVSSLYAYAVGNGTPHTLRPLGAVPLAGLPRSQWPDGIQEAQGGVVVARGNNTLLIMSSSASLQPVFTFDISGVASGGAAQLVAAQATGVGGEPEGVSFLDGHLLAVVHTRSLLSNVILQYGSGP
ncbi:uncharacterized protein AMSG_03759 [Thecamonas trahens ATCC 50062]|uniref:Uncharacterized protein n=1 Tax=Thecamonas trahens ATCC 50062 TaxID=461836 RepID=A0A0L0D5G2_THETB|nr:hypothetical protein AMSG_03759 [Thecamonas trahens ATCC 50062]KNC47326.1 hypothetical protein AMSG_03759 [Thecamonas trahens ATCC 50062]|eukprot:XP_013759664.1 hypothetical protein AMSG_03759 [Thecamonas trahens ATCC 50062]